MGYYSGKFIIHNNTDDYKIDDYKKLGHIITFKFSANFNGTRLYLSNTLLKQLLDSNALQKFIIDDCSKYIKENQDLINASIKKTCTIENYPNIKIKVIGKYFFIEVYCGRNHSTDDCINAIKRKLSNEKTRDEILRGI